MILSVISLSSPGSVQLLPGERAFQLRIQIWTSAMAMDQPVWVILTGETASVKHSQPLILHGRLLQTPLVPSSSSFLPSFEVHGFGY